MIRLATLEDSEQLLLLNEQFNGEGETNIDEVKQSLLNNKQELVVVAQENDILVAFICIQIKKSFYYSDVSAEITEVFVVKEYRRRKIASKLIEYAENYCKQHYSLHKFELLTGEMNVEAQATYKSLGYNAEDEIRMVKRW